MTAAIVRHAEAAPPLAPVTATLRSMFGTDELPGLHRGLLVHDEAGWMPASVLADGSELPRLLDAAGTPLAGRVDARGRRAGLEGVQLLARAAGRPRLGLGPPGAAVARVRRADPLRGQAAAGDDRLPAYDRPWRCCRPTRWPSPGCPRCWSCPTRRRLLDAMRTSLLDGHVTPMLDAIHHSVRARATYPPRLVVLRHRQRHPARGRRAARRHGRQHRHGARGARLDDLVEIVPGAGGEPFVQRRTCCLAFTLPEPKLCSGCCIKPA